MDPWGNDIQVQYWVDSLGFHRSDNLPKYDLMPVTETPEVKQAREEHERLWKAAAKLNGVDPDSNDAYSPHAEKLEENNYDDDHELEGQVSNQHQSLSRYPILPYSNHIKPENARSFGKIKDDSVVIDAANINNLRTRFARKQNNFDENEETTGEPRGFFYSFDYPVSVVSGRKARLQHSEAQASENVETSVDFHSSNEETSRQQPRTLLGTIIPEEVSNSQSNQEQESSQVKPLERESKTSEPEDPQLSHKQMKPTRQTSEKNPSRNRGSIKFNSKTK